MGDFTSRLVRRLWPRRIQARGLHFTPSGPLPRPGLRPSLCLYCLEGCNLAASGLGFFCSPHLRASGLQLRRIRVRGHHFTLSVSSPHLGQGASLHLVWLDGSGLFVFGFESLRPVRPLVTFGLEGFTSPRLSRRLPPCCIWDRGLHITLSGSSPHQGSETSLQLV